MEFWSKQVDQLESALQENAQALMLHFLRTASSEVVAELVGRDFAQANSNVRSSVAATLATRLLLLTAHESSAFDQRAQSGEALPDLALPAEST